MTSTSNKRASLPLNVTLAIDSDEQLQTHCRQAPLDLLWKRSSETNAQRNIGRVKNAEDSKQTNIKSNPSANEDIGITRFSDTKAMRKTTSGFSQLSLDAAAAPETFLPQPQDDINKDDILNRIRAMSMSRSYGNGDSTNRRHHLRTRRSSRRRHFITWEGSSSRHPNYDEPNCQDASHARVAMSSLITEIHPNSMGEEFFSDDDE